MTKFGNLLYRLENIVQRDVIKCDSGYMETFAIDIVNRSHYFMLTGGKRNIFK